MIYFAKDHGSIQVPVIASIAGLLGQFVGGYCFYLYNKSMQHVTNYFGRLSRIQDTMLAVRLSQSIEDSSLKNQMITRVVETLLSRSSDGSPGSYPSGSAPSTNAHTRPSPKKRGASADQMNTEASANRSSSSAERIDQGHRSVRSARTRPR